MEYYICAMIKDEQAYLDEWIRYHLSIGFSRLFLYEDTGSMSHKEVTDKYDQVELNHIDNIRGELKPCTLERACGIQVSLFEYFIKRHNDGWCLFSDIDEFLVLKDVNSLDELIEPHSDSCGINIDWLCFGSCGRVNKEEGNVMDLYTKPSVYQEHSVTHRTKAFVNLCKPIRFVTNHMIENGEHTDKCVLNHYVTKSFEEWCWQIKKRGDVCKARPRNFRYYFRFNTNFRICEQQMIDMAIEKGWIDKGMEGRRERYDKKKNIFIRSNL